jgi:hypothetical protein
MTQHDATPTGGTGLGFTPFETRAEVIVGVAREADRLGYARVGVAEAMGHASPVLLAEVALATTRVELATTVLPVWSRSPAVLAMLAADGSSSVSGPGRPRWWRACTAFVGRSRSASCGRC